MTKNKIDYSSQVATIKYGLYEIKVTRQELETTIANMKELEALENIVARAEKIMVGTQIKLDL
jgi:hypothetical protein